MEPNEIQNLYVSTLDETLRGQLKIALNLINLVQDHGCEVISINPFNFFTGQDNELQIKCDNKEGEPDKEKALLVSFALDQFFAELGGKEISEELT